MKLAGYGTLVVRNLEHDLRRRIAERDCAEILRMLRRKNKSKTELSSLAEEFLDRRATIKRQPVRFIKHDKALKRCGAMRLNESNQVPEQKLGHRALKRVFNAF